MHWFILYAVIGLGVAGAALSSKRSGFQAYLNDPSFRTAGQWRNLLEHLGLSLLLGLCWGPGLLGLVLFAAWDTLRGHAAETSPPNSPAKRTALLEGQPLPDSTLELCGSLGQPQDDATELHLEMAVTLEILQTASHRYWSFIALNARYKEQQKDTLPDLLSLEAAGLVEAYREHLTPAGCQLLQFTATDTPTRFWYKLTDKGRETPPYRGQRQPQRPLWGRGGRAHHVY